MFDEEVEPCSERRLGQRIRTRSEREPDGSAHRGCERYPAREEYGFYAGVWDPRSQRTPIGSRPFGSTTILTARSASGQAM